MINKRNSKKSTVLDIRLDGKLRFNGDNSLAKPGDFSTLQNLRPIDGGIRGIMGMSKINTNAPTTYTVFDNAYHFRKSQPAETHLLVQAFNSGKTASQILENTTAIPSAGDFSATQVFTEDSSNPTGYFAQGPNGTVIYCNSNDSLIWGGVEAPLNGFKASDGTNYADVFEYLATPISGTGHEWAMSTLTTLYIGALRPLDGFKIYVGTANTTSATMTVKYWSGTAWTAVSSLTDNTASSGKSLAQTGTVTFTSTVSTAKVREVESSYLYWYQVTFSASPDATTKLYYITLSAPMQNIVDLWDGTTMTVLDWTQLAASVYYNNTSNVKEEDFILGNAETFAVVYGGAGPELYVGFDRPAMGIVIRMQDNYVNTSASTMTVKYWSGTAWTAVSGLVDGTSTSGKTLNTSGLVSWTPVARGLESKRKIKRETTYYYYQLTFSAALGGYTDVDYAVGVPAPIFINNYKFPLFFQNRVVLCSEQSGAKNKILIGSQATTGSYSGTDSDEKLIGDDRELTAGTTVFTRFSNLFYEVGVLTKENETWLLDGTSIDTYELRRVSSHYGCVAPRTMVSCNIGVDIDENNPGRSVAIWQSSNAICMFDGNSIKEISVDISEYFNPNAANSLFINSSMKSKSTAFFDPVHAEYHWMFATGTNTSLNKELVYSLKYGKWYEIVRTGLALQGGLSVYDTNGNAYAYGWTTAGFMMRLENTANFSATSIPYVWQFADKPFTESLLHEVEINSLKHVAVAKNTTAQTVAVNHYGNTNTTESNPTGVTFSLANANGRVAAVTKAVEWPMSALHSMKFSISTNDESPGYEPLYVSVLMNPRSVDNP